MTTFDLRVGDCREVLASLPAGSARCCVTSPPYWGLRDYGVDGQLGLESTPDAYVAEMVGVFREVRRVLADDGTAWINLGDSYANDGKWGGSTGGKHVAALHGSAIGRARRDTGLKPKDLVGIPWRIAFALQADGWYLRSDIIWSKPNPMPESVTDRPTKAHEYLFLLAKAERYYYDADAIKEPAIYGDNARNGVPGTVIQSPGQPKQSGLTRVRSEGSGHADKQRGHGRRHAGFNERWDAMPRAEQCAGTRNRRTVWTISPQPYSGAHFAVMPEDLVEPCIRAGSARGDKVLDPFAGTATVGHVALRLGRSFVGSELNPKYAQLARERCAAVQPVLSFPSGTHSATT